MSGRTRIGAVVLGCAGLALLALLASSRAASVRPKSSEGGAHDRARAPHAVARQASKVAEPSSPAAHDEPVFAGPGPDDAAGPGMLPHPITAEHLRAYRDVELLDGAWRALKARDFERARELLSVHATEYASGYDDMQDGLSLLADCMQYPSATSRDRATRFYTERTASSMRRRIRTHCLQAR